MRVTIEIDADPAQDKVFLTIRRAEGPESKSKTILTFPFDRDTAKRIIGEQIAEVLTPAAARPAAVRG